MTQTTFDPTHQPARSVVNYCRHCGHSTHMQVPSGDNQARAVCPACGTIHYINPLLVVGTVPVWQGQILLCKRNIEPRKGFWTLPAGFMELNETTAEGAARETQEEAGAQFTMGDLCAVMNVPQAGQVHLFYNCQLTSDQFAPGEETQEARLFAPADIPWQDIAFPTVKSALKAWLQQSKNGHIAPVYLEDFQAVSLKP